jgi:methionine-rich copper-binding protein CopC
LAGNAFGGMSGAITWNFTTGDFTVPTVSTLSPADNATGVAMGSNLVITFSKSVQKGTGNLLIKKSDGSVVETIDVTSGAVSIVGTVATIDPTITLAGTTGYYVEVAAGAFKDLAGNAFGGMSGATTWNFTTGDFTAPTVSTLTPADDVNGVALGPNLVITFNESVQKGTGKLLVRRADGSAVETIDVASGPVSIVGAVVTIDPTITLAGTTGYYVEVAAGTFKDLAGNSFAGISGATAWNFTTGDFTPPTVTALLPADDVNGVALDPNLVITFSESVQKGTGTLLVKRADGSTVETIDLASGAVSIAGAVVTIDPTSSLTETTGYYVEVAAGAFKDMAGNAFVGVSGTTAWNFTTGDFTPLTVTISRAAEQASPTRVSPIYFTVVFSEPVTDFATGDVALSGTAGATDAVVADRGDHCTYDVAVSGMTGSGTVIATIPAGVVSGASLIPNLGSTGTDNTIVYTDISPTTIGLFDPASSYFRLRCSNTSGMADHTFGYGEPGGGWTVLTGDWNGDGQAGVGLYDPKASTFYLSNAYQTGYAEHTFGYGEPGGGWIPLVGDWNGDGHAGVGLYDPKGSTFYLTDTLASGFAEHTFGYGEPGGGWLPLVGDWNGDGRTGVGLYNPHASTFYLTDTLASGYAEHTFGYGEPGGGWTPLVGDWNGDGSAGVGLFAPQSSTFYLTNAFASGFAQHTFGYGEPNAGWKPLVGDWNGNGAAGVGLYAPQSSTFYLTDTLSSGYAEYTAGFGSPGAGWQPLAGCWGPAPSATSSALSAEAVDQIDLAELLTELDSEDSLLWLG